MGIRHHLAPALFALAIALTSANAIAAGDTATVSFGQWMSSPPLDRFPNFQGSPTTNVHAITPNMVTIKAGGSVNFIISGLHNIVIYDDGVLPTDINVADIIFPTNPPPAVPLINDANRRIYRGLDPTANPLQDRVEVVNFSKPGIYLVICGVLPHFQEGMYGFVRVLP